VLFSLRRDCGTPYCSFVKRDIVATTGSTLLITMKVFVRYAQSKVTFSDAELNGKRRTRREEKQFAKISAWILSREVEPFRLVRSSEQHYAINSVNQNQNRYIDILQSACDQVWLFIRCVSPTHLKERVKPLCLMKKVANGFKENVWESKKTDKENVWETQKDRHRNSLAGGVAVS